jgi:hypothetical protein
VNVSANTNAPDHCSESMAIFHSSGKSLLLKCLPELKAKTISKKAFYKSYFVKWDDLNPSQWANRSHFVVIIYLMEYVFGSKTLLMQTSTMNRLMKLIILQSP